MENIIPLCILCRSGGEHRRRSLLLVLPIYTAGRLMGNTFSIQDSATMNSIFIGCHQMAVQKKDSRPQQVLMMDPNTAPMVSTFISTRCAVEQCRSGA